MVSLPTAFAQIVETKGQNYDLVENFFIGEAIWNSTPERIMNGGWQNYALSNTDDKIIFNTNSVGSFVFDKNSCSYSIYGNGFDGEQIIPSVSAVATYLNNGQWQNLPINDEACTVTVEPYEDGVFLTSTKVITEDITEDVFIPYTGTTENFYANATNANFELIGFSNGTNTGYYNGETITDQNVEEFTQELRLDIRDGFKETFKVIHDGNQELGISQTIHSETGLIEIADQVLNIAELNGESYNRQYLEDNQAQVFEIANGLNYDFDTGFNSLSNVNMLFENNTYKVNMDFSEGNFVGYLEIDPTFTATGSISGSNWNFDLSTLPSNTIISSGTIDGTSLTGTQITNAENAQGSTWSTASVVPTYKYHKLTSTSTFTTDTNLSADFLLIGAGGGGGGEGGAGGGSGGGLYEEGRTVTSGSYSVTIGSGGAGSFHRNAPTSSNEGGDSTFDSMTAKGGGAGGGQTQSGTDGGSGGGSGHNVSGSQSSNQGTYSGVNSYGTGSASCSGSSSEGQGGGGLYSAPANCGNGLNLNVGGSGLGGTNHANINTMLIDTSSGYQDGSTGNYYIGGGGAGSGGYTQARSLGGGGDSGSNYGMSATGTGGAGIASTGSGGGGGWGSGATGGAGADGIFIIKFLDSGATTTGGSTHTASGTANSSPSLSLTYTIATVPNAITDLSASFNSPNIDLTSSNPSDGGSAITSFKVYRDTGSGYSLYATVSSSTLTSYQDTNPVSGVINYYKINAVNSVGEASDSNVGSVLSGVPPNAPTGVSASITNTATAPLVVTVSFSPSGTTGTGTVTGFQLLRDGVAVATDGLVTSLQDTAPAGGTTYAYTVKALGTHGNSVASSSSSVTTPNTPAQVTGLTVTPVSTSRIDLSWNTPSDNNSLISGYKVQISSNGGSSYTDVLTGNVNTVYQALSLATNSQYHFKVSAINGVGTGTASAVSNTYTMTPTPASLSATPVSEVQINLSWGASTGASGYKIEYESPVDDGFTTLVNNTGTVGTTYSASGLTTATQYNFKVSGWNNGGTSVASPEASSYTWGILQAPVLDTITRLSPTSLKLDFTAGTGLPVATGYKIERQTGSGWIELIADTGNTDVTYTDYVLSSDQSATYRLYAINNIGTSLVSNELTSDAVASSGGGGGGSSSRAVSSQTGSTGLIDLTFIDQIHRVVLGQFLSKSINVAWDSSDNLEVKSIIVSDSPFRIVFQDVPFVLIGDQSGISNGKINYSVQIPSELCTQQGQVNCVEQKQYEVPVEIQSVHKGSTLTKSSVIKIDLAGGSDIPLVFVLLAIGAVPLAFIIRKVGSGKSRRKASGSSHKSSKNGSNSKKVSL